MQLEVADLDAEIVLLFIDDGDMLIMANAVLASGNRRILMAWSAASALWILENWRVGSVVIREGMEGCRQVQLDCLKRGLNVYLMHGVVDNEIIRLTLPVLGGLVEGFTAPAVL